MINIKTATNNNPNCVGAGLIALDVIINGVPSTPAKLCAGGSCGNVLSILSFLGWKSKPIGRLANNKAAENLLTDFSNFKVDTSLISTTEDGKTPIIIHRILKDKEGNPKHKFEFKVPETNFWLPMYKPVLASAVGNVISKQTSSNVFYFDRVSRSTIDLAKYYKSTGALIVFEPSSLNDSKQFLECLSISDIIKFSSDRISNYSELFPIPNAPLEIETLGKNGLQYRLKANKQQKWKTIPSFKIESVIDSAGAGDWCTAGIINELGFNGVESFNNANIETIEKALSIGQVLGGINCAYDGARGIMYNMDYESLVKTASAILNKKDLPTVKTNKIKIITVKDFRFDSIF